MIDPKDLEKRVETLNELLQAKLGLRGKTLSSRLKKARRSLPKRLRREGQVIVDAQEKSSHPKLALIQDQSAVNVAFHEIMTYLKDIDPDERRKTNLLRWLAAQVLNIIIITIIVVLLLRWQGLV